MHSVGSDRISSLTLEPDNKKKQQQSTALFSLVSSVAGRIKYFNAYVLVSQDATVYISMTFLRI